MQVTTNGDCIQLQHEWRKMKVNEIFYSVQGEGRFAGTPAVFLRLSGCNLRCSFCDTDHRSYVQMTEDEIVSEASAYKSRHIVITGGEPTLQLTASLARKLHDKGFFIQIETNGTVPLEPDCDIDWITCSPKQACEGKSPVARAGLKIQRIDELKVVFWGQDVSSWENFSGEIREYRLQPLDTQDADRNEDILRKTVAYILEHPLWKLSLQTHKLINVK